MWATLKIALLRTVRLALERKAAAKTALTLCLAMAAASTPAAAAVELPRTWEPYRNARYGFELMVPSDLLVDTREAENADGRMWSSADGRIRLIAGAVRNPDQSTLAGYRDYLISDVYAGASLDYAPVRRTWFVISGTRAGEMFYERVTFACGGKVIYGWQLTYPVETRGVLDRVVEAIHRTYRAGRGEDGQC